MQLLRKLLTGICQRGCTIEINDIYPSDHLPKCLVTINNNIADPENAGLPIEFKISSMICENNHIYVVRSMHSKNIDNVFFTVLPDKSRCYLLLDKTDCYRRRNDIQLDILLYCLHRNADIKPFNSPVSGVLCYINKSPLTTIPIKNYLENKLINELMIYRMVLNKINMPREIRYMITYYIVRLDKWNNLMEYTSQTGSNDW